MGLFSVCGASDYKLGIVSLKTVPVGLVIIIQAMYPMLSTSIAVLVIY